MYVLFFFICSFHTIDMYTKLSSYYDVSSPMFASSILNHIPTVVFLHVGLVAKMPLSTSNEER